MSINSRPHKLDYEGAKLGMWTFLFTELLLFAGLFMLYSVFRSKYSHEFHMASAEMDRTIGTLNTIVLLTSSLTMALSINAIRNGKKNASLLLQGLTVFFGIVFLVNKYFEWDTKIRHGLFPDAPELLQRGSGDVIYYGLYYLMTGVHGLHVLAGVILLAIMMVLTVRDRISADNYVSLENSGLYWHLVDIIWVYLFPVFYLIR